MSQQNDIMSPPLNLERRTYWGVDGVEKYTFRLLDSTHVLIRELPSYDAALAFWSMEYPFRALYLLDRTVHRPCEDKQPWIGIPYIDTGDYT